MTDPENPDDQQVSDDDWAAAMSEQSTDQTSDTKAAPDEAKADAAETDAPQAETGAGEDGAGEDTAPASSEDSPASTPSPASGRDGEDDPWAEAMAEQAAAESESEAATTQAPTPEPTPPRAASQELFAPFGEAGGSGQARDLEMIMDIPVKLTVELGRTKLTIKQLLELAQGSVIELDGLAGEPMDILINGYLVAQGEVVVIEDKYGIRITEIVTPSERIHKLNR